MQWYYFDNNGFKQGPITSSQLKALAEKGIITQETIIENETGKVAKASQVK